MNNSFLGLDVVDNIFWGYNEKKAESPAIPANYILAVGRQITKKNFIFLLRSYYKYMLRM